MTEVKEKVIIKKHHDHYHGNHSNAIYGLGVIGALFYFLQNASSFETIIMGIGKAVFWPAILMFKLLTYLQI
ncbi:MAG: hypothetical protein AAB778_02085 [Patescibacteria group bacterium]